MNAAPRRILLLLLLPIGDTLFATPTVRALRRRYPKAELTALAYPTNAGILEANPDIDRLLLHPMASTWSGPASYWRFLRDLRRARFNLVVEFGPAQGWLRWFLCPRRFRALDFPLWQWFLPFGSRPWRDRHAVESYAGLLTQAERRLLPIGPVLHCTEADRIRMGGVLATLGAAPILAVHPGGEGFRGMKRWPVERFAAVTHDLVKRWGARIVILGGADELELAERFKAYVPRALSLAGSLSLSETVAVLERCFLFLGNDSAPLHMAGALGVPTVGIYGPTNPENFRPRGRNVSVVRSTLPCSPCFHFVGSGPVWAGSRCKLPRCLHAISTTMVENAADEALARV
jgi:ADP-heptose:LPS heptosyltransferase